MNFLHYVIDNNENQIESIYSNSNSIKFSMQCLAQIKDAEYRIWNKETNEVIIVEKL